MIDIKKLASSKIDFLDEVISLSKEATEYIESFPWCNKIIKGWLGKEWGYMFCVFYFEIDPKLNSNADKYVWAIVGDIPPAYIDIKSASNVSEAMEGYIFLMEDWIEHVRNNQPVTECYPIDVKPTREYAEMLYDRIQIIKEDFLSEVKE